MPSDAALEFVKDVVRHIHFYAEVDYDENVEHTVDGFFVRVYKDVEGTKDDEVCYSTQIEFDHVDNIVHIVQRKSLDDNLTRSKRLRNMYRTCIF